MSTGDIAATVKEIYSLYESDTESAVTRLFQVLDDDVRWCSLANGCVGAEFTKERNGLEQVKQYFEDLSADWEMIHFTVDEFVCENDRVVMIGSCGWKHRRTGKSIDSPKVDLWRIRDDKIVEFQELYDTAKMMAAV